MYQGSKKPNISQLQSQNKIDYYFCLEIAYYVFWNKEASLVFYPFEILNLQTNISLYSIGAFSDALAFSYADAACSAALAESAR